MDMTEILKALADANRLRILDLLNEKKLCVCDLESILELNQSNLSRHLAKLRQAGLVTAEKQALFTFYSRARLAAPYEQIVNDICGAMRRDPRGASDRKRLNARLRVQKRKCDCD